MPANKYALLRYRIIDRCISNQAQPYPSKSDLREACEEALYGSDGEHISDSTIEKDLWAMRYESELGYYAPIAYSKAHKGYFYEEDDYTINDIRLNDEDLNALHFAAETFQQFRDIPIFRQYQQAIDKVVSRLKVNPDLNSGTEHFIQFEDAPEVKGIEHLGPIAEAIRSQKKIRFSYTKFSDDSEREHLAAPYLLKEYRNRWYLICKDDAHEGYRTYGLDRIKGLKATKKSFDADPGFDSDQFFKHSIGITQLDSAPTEVCFECDEVLAKYLDSQPLHRSQRIETNGASVKIVHLRVLVTFELVSTLLSYGSSVNVLSPESLRQRMKKALQASLAKY